MIAEAIARHLKENGINQRLLCKKTGLTSYCVNYALKRKRNFSLDEYEKICDALQVPYEYFFEQTEDST